MIFECFLVSLVSVLSELVIVMRGDIDKFLYFCPVANNPT